jgi:hypothetical protein
MSWKPEVKVNGIWERNGLCYATEAEARDSALCLFNRWHSCDDSRAIPSGDPVNVVRDIELGVDKFVEAV